MFNPKFLIVSIALFLAVWVGSICLWEPQLEKLQEARLMTEMEAKKLPAGRFLVDRANVISGNVVDSYGVPIRGVLVRLYDLSSVENVLMKGPEDWPEIQTECSESTGEQGAFRFSDVTYGAKTLVFSHSNFMSDSLVELPHVDGYGLLNQRIVLQQRTSRVLQLVNRSAFGIGGVDVTIFPQFWGESPVTSVTDENGFFIVPEAFNENLVFWVEIDKTKIYTKVLPTESFIRKPESQDYYLADLDGDSELQVELVPEHAPFGPPRMITAMVKDGVGVLGKLPETTWIANVVGKAKKLAVIHKSELSGGNVVPEASELGQKQSIAYHLVGAQPLAWVSILKKRVGGGGLQVLSETSIDRVAPSAEGVEVGLRGRRAVRTSRPFLPVFVSTHDGKAQWGRSNRFGDLAINVGGAPFIAWSINNIGVMTYPKGGSASSSDGLHFNAMDERLQTERCIYGFVFGTDRAPVKGAEVWAQGPRDRFPSMVETDDNGFFRFDGLTPGEHILFSRRAGISDQAVDRIQAFLPFKGEGEPKDLRQDLTVFMETTDVLLEGLTSIDNIIIRNLSDLNIVFSRLQMNASFTVSNLKPGQYRIQYSTNGRLLEEDFRVSENVSSQVILSNE